MTYAPSMTYRELVTPTVLTWSFVSVLARLPVAMAPMALVFLLRERPGGYGLGAVLAAAYVAGEVLGATVLGPRLRADRARAQMAAGLAVGAGAFAGLGAVPYGHPVVLGALAVLAGAAPAAAPGGLRAMLTHLVPERLVPRALSAETMITYAVWAVAPALTSFLALAAASYAPLLLAAGLAAAAAVGMRALPTGNWAGDEDLKSTSMLRTVSRAWPIYVTGAASISLLALTELVLPALLEQRGIGVGWSGPLLAGFSVACAVGAFGYGTRSWPGKLRTQSLVLLVAVAFCVAAVAVIPALMVIVIALLLAGLLQSGVQITRNLTLREELPASAFAAGNSVMYAAVGVGYAASAVLSGAVQSVATPEVAVLAGVGLTLLLTLVSALGERRTRVPPQAEPAPEPAPASGST